MKHSLPALAALTCLAGCPSDDGNPDVLWLALDGRETEVRLVGDEPQPF